MPQPAPISTAHSVHVQLTERSYDVCIGRGLLPQIGQAAIALSLGNNKKCVVVTESTVGPLYAETVVASLTAAGFVPTLITVPAGEASKSMYTVEDVCRQMLRAGLDRHSFLVALGGGVIGDLAGFAASIFLRGIPFIQVPTTVLAQVDSSVGGKTGVNTAEGKNLLGTFSQPALVLADIDTLSSLPPRAHHEGFAEIIKHAAIRDANMFDEINAIADGTGDLADLIQRNVAIKARIVEADEHETTGLRALLNFGHTIGHAIEASAGYGQLLHGEAISLGMIAAARLSVQLAGLPQDEADQITALLTRFSLPTRLTDATMTTDTILGYLKLDKKFKAGRIRFVLLRSLGDAFVSSDVSEAHIISAIEALRV